MESRLRGDEGTRAAREIEAIWREYIRAHDRGDSSGVARWLTEDAVVLAPGLPDVEGRAGFERLVSDSFATATFEDLEIVSRELDVHGDRAYQIAEFSETMFVEGKEPRHLRGRFMAQWVRRREGWRIRRYISNAAPHDASRGRGDGGP